MNVREFRRLRVGDEVYAHFSSAYRSAVVTALEQQHVCVEARSAKGGTLARRAKYQSVDTRAIGRSRHGIQDFACDYCGGNDEDPQGHCMDCARPQGANAN